MLRQYHTEAVILRVQNLGETDNRLTVFTRESGLKIVLARGVRKLTSRRAPYLDLFNHCRIHLARGRNFDIVTDVSPLNNFAGIRSDLTRVAGAFKFSELIIRLLPEGEEHAEVYRRLLSGLASLDDIASPLDEKALIAGFSRFLLENLGYIPAGRQIPEKDLDRILEDVMEKKIRTNDLLAKLA